MVKVLIRLSMVLTDFAVPFTTTNQLQEDSDYDD